MTSLYRLDCHQQSHLPFSAPGTGSIGEVMTLRHQPSRDKLQSEGLQHLSRLKS